MIDMSSISPIDTKLFAQKSTIEDVVIWMRLYLEAKLEQSCVTDYNGGRVRGKF